MMRLFVQHANRTVIVALKAGDTITDLMDKCSNKFGDDLPVLFRLCLDVDEHPIVEKLDEVRDGDKICVKAFTVPEATLPDTLSPPNTVALGIFEDIVTAIKKKTLKLPMNGLKAYERNTITSNKIHPIRMLLKNQLVPIPSDEPDFWTILDMVAKQNNPKSTELHKKLSSAIDLFRELRELNPSLQ